MAKNNKANEKSAQLGIEVEKDKAFGKWYTQVVTRASLIEYYDISGCYILRPNAYAVWEAIQGFLDAQIKASGVKNCYFPLLVSEAALTKEESHLEGFSPEVAWVTRAGHSELGNPVAIRPTSETIMYPIFSKWISSHRDLPLRVNQWTNIVRWEFKDAVPFIRSREFLWQEGHSAFATKEEADKEVLEILDYYRRAYEDVLAVPVTPGKKSEKEKFAGADYTTTIEAFIPTNGRGVQAATSHCLGQTFSNEKMFNISFNDDSGSTKFVFQNSWGFTTRSIGVMIMTHGDNKGLVLPPRVAPTQVVIIPIHFKNKIEIVNDKCAEVLAALKKAGVRTEFDSRPYNPGWKHNDHELHGVPVRIEIGPRDAQNNTCVVCRRDKPNKEDKITVTIDENFGKTITDLLEQLQADLFTRAKALKDAQTRQITKWEDFVPTLNEKNVILAPWCEKPECEDEVKKRSKQESESITSDDEVGHQLTGAAKSLCIPFNQPELPVGIKCFCCGGDAKSWTLFGRSY